MKERYIHAMIMAAIPWLPLTWFGYELHASGIMPGAVSVTVLSSAVGGRIGLEIGKDLEG
jgi:hypothetical protein